MTSLLIITEPGTRSSALVDVLTRSGVPVIMAHDGQDPVAHTAGVLAANPGRTLAVLVDLGLVEAKQGDVVALVRHVIATTQVQVATLTCRDRTRQAVLEGFYLGKGIDKATVGQLTQHNLNRLSSVRHGIKISFVAYEEELNRSWPKLVQSLGIAINTPLQPGRTPGELIVPEELADTVDALRQAAAGGRATRAGQGKLPQARGARGVDQTIEMGKENRFLRQRQINKASVVGGQTDLRLSTAAQRPSVTNPSDISTLSLATVGGAKPGLQVSGGGRRSSGPARANLNAQAAADPASVGLRGNGRGIPAVAPAPRSGIQRNPSPGVPILGHGTGGPIGTAPLAGTPQLMPAAAVAGTVTSAPLAPASGPAVFPQSAGVPAWPGGLLPGAQAPAPAGSAFPAAAGGQGTSPAALPAPAPVVPDLTVMEESARQEAAREALAMAIDLAGDPSQTLDVGAGMSPWQDRMPGACSTVSALHFDSWKIDHRYDLVFCFDRLVQGGNTAVWGEKLAAAGRCVVVAVREVPAGNMTEQVRAWLGRRENAKVTAGSGSFRWLILGFNVPDPVPVDEDGVKSTPGRKPAKASKRKKDDAPAEVTA